MIQLTGMASGMDTESMIEELVKASSYKKTRLEGEQKKMQWTQDAWSTLNTDIYSFYSKTLEELKWESAYNTKKTTVADESLASIVSADNAIEGTQTLAVKQMAKTGYLTGAQLSGVKKSSTMGDLGILQPGDSVGWLSINKEKIGFDYSTTVDSFLTQLKNAGVTASFDEENQRFFISANESGTKADFTLTADDDNGLKVLSGLGLLTKDDAKMSAYTYYTDMTAEDKAQVISDDAQALADKYYAATQALLAANSDLETEKNNKQDEYDAYINSSEYLDAFAVAESDRTDEQKAAVEKATKLQNEIGALESTISSNSSTIDDNKTYYTENGDGTVSANLKATLEVTNSLNKKITTAQKVVNAANASTGAVRIQGQDAKILLNGAEFTSKSNSFSINGMTITAKNVSDKNADGTYKVTNITTSLDVDGIYDKLVNFFDKYNELLTKFEKNYNADSARDYSMLTSEEKEELDDDEVKAWEDKIKDSLLRKDDNLSTLMNTFVNAMNKSYTIDGKKYALSNFGIESLSYFISGANEHNNLHINGNEKDEDTKDNPDMLKKMLSTDPHTTMKFFSQLLSDFYNSMNKLAAGDELSSRNKFYNDKLMQSSYDDYKTKISDQQKKLDNMESQYRSQFTAMEKAMTVLNSQTSYVTSLFTT